MKKEKIKWSEMTKKQKILHIIDCVTKSIILLIIGACVVTGIVMNAKGREKVARADETYMETTEQEKVERAGENPMWATYANIQAYFQDFTIRTLQNKGDEKYFNISKVVDVINTPVGKRVINKKEDINQQNLMSIQITKEITSKRIAADIVHFYNSIYALTPGTFASIRIGQRYYEYNYDCIVMNVEGDNYYALSNDSILDMYKKCTQIEEMCIANRGEGATKISIPGNLVKVNQQPLNAYNYSFDTMQGNTSYKNLVGHLNNGVYATEAGYVYECFKEKYMYGICVNTATNNNLYITGNYIVYKANRTTRASNFMQAIGPNPYYIIRGYNQKPSETQFLYIEGEAGIEKGMLCLNQVEPSFKSLIYDEGYKKGYEDGYNRGYVEGASTATDFNPVGMMIEPIAQLFNIKIFGDFSIGNFFTAALFVTLALSFLKMFAGG